MGGINNKKKELPWLVELTAEGDWQWSRWEDSPGIALGELHPKALSSAGRTAHEALLVQGDPAFCSSPQ